jgi:Raf kinase inhibitor-like YbhB/YbcL family protein
MTMSLSSSAFKNNEPVPRKYTEDGSDVSPPMAWSEGPAGTKEFALILDDPDAPSKEPWVHWVIYKIPADVRALKENVPPKPRLEDPPGALQGRNSWPSGRTVGYRGPAPPAGHGTHHYQFHIYALDAAVALEPEMDKASLERAMRGHILAEGRLVGTYGR